MKNNQTVNGDLSWDDLFQNIKIRLFYIVSVLVFSGNIVDLISLGMETNNPVLYINLGNVAIVITVFILFRLNRIKVKLGNIIAIYSIIANILISLMIGLWINQGEIGYLLREGALMAALMLAAGFAIHRKHTIILGTLYLLYLCLFTYISKNDFLIASLPVLIVSNGGYIVGIHLLLKLIEKNNLKQLELNRMLNESVQELDEQKNGLQELNDTKDKFFSIIAHDLIQPFNTLIGFSELLYTRIKRKDYSRIEQSSKLLFNVAKQTFDLLTNLLEWSRSQTGRLKFNPEHIELRDLVNELEKLLNETAQKKDIIAKNKIPVGLKVFGDRNMIYTILRNLYSNAIKYSHPNSEVIFRATRVNKAVEIAIQDFGTGISEENQKKIFRVETNYSEKGTDNEKGTGLGLVLCKEFVQYHRGKIWTESKLGEGSIFKFVVPDPEEES